MSVKTLKLDSEVAKKLYKSADAAFKATLEETFGKATFSDKIQDRIETFEDVLEIAGKEYEEIVPWKYPKTKAHRSQNALAKLQLISEVYNEGKELDWNNRNQYKWYSWFEKKSGGWVRSGSGAGHVYVYCSGVGPYFYSEELAIDAANKFLNLYNELLP